jgi:hypothetical protein
MRREIACRVVAAILACASTIVASEHPTKRVHLVGKTASGRSLVVERDGQSVTAFKLPPWVEPDELSVSPSGNYALIFAKLHAGESRTATIIDVSSPAAAHVTGTFKPGVGGFWSWSKADTTILVAGCGTACATVQVRDVAGRQLAAFLCDGFDDGQELSPDHGYFACFSSQPKAPDRGQVDVVDTTTGQVAVHANLPCRGFSGMDRDNVRFDTAAKKLTFDCSVGNPQRVAAMTVSWATRAARN